MSNWTLRILRVLDPIRRMCRFGHALRVSKSPTWASILARHGVDVGAWPCQPRDDGLFFSNLGTVVTKDGGGVLLRDIRKAAALHERGISFSTSGGAVRATVGQISLNVETAEELQILEEVFLDGIYNFELGGPLLIVDVGMNVAYAALYLAATHPQAIVCAYEPFLPTFRCAEVNIGLNSVLQERIHGHPFGLSDSNRFMNVEYTRRWRGSVGVYGVPPALRVPGEVELEKCELRDAEVELTKLFDEYPNRRVVLKVDCEGSEYSIVTRLANGKAVDAIDLMMIECHRRARDHDPVALRELLSSLGFGWIHQEPDSPDISMLYAFRKKTDGSESSRSVLNSRSTWRSGPEAP